MVERQMRRSVKAVGDFWYTAWVDAGQPDLKSIMDYHPTQDELAERKEELNKRKEMMFKPRRTHEDEGGN
jgi:protein tyrosine phosphatase